MLHRDIVGARDHRAIKPKATPRATRDTAARAVAALKGLTGSVSAVTTRMQDTVDSLDRAATGLRALADRRRVMMDAAPPPSGLVSATSGYVRDSAGNRVRPMTPADLNDAADRHYKRGAYASPPASAATDRAAPEPPRRPTTAAELQAINDKFWGRTA